MESAHPLISFYVKAIQLVAEVFKEKLSSSRQLISFLVEPIQFAIDKLLLESLSVLL